MSKDAFVALANEIDSKTPEVPNSLFSEHRIYDGTTQTRNISEPRFAITLGASYSLERMVYEKISFYCIYIVNPMSFATDSKIVEAQNGN